ncbi:XkdQ/YqbQ family protein [Longirhabdus pacifica]|uniref:XkdQ/YqbQ family protein n=1 Tax=Longirhabdus pacifica TaxID=2305227 RepID=UPI001008D2EB|nr:hypothetical protein [Longirhabdus pacifica]
MNIKVEYNKETVLNPIVNRITWSGNQDQPFRKCEINVHNTVDGKSTFIDFEPGKSLRLLKDDQELFRGVIFTDQMDLQGSMSLTAYDENVYLTKNIDTKKFVNKKASDIVKQCCKEFNIPTGTIVDTTYNIPKLLLRDRTLWDMMKTALAETEDHTGKKYILSSKQGKLHLLDVAEEEVEWKLEQGVNILSASHSKSIEEMKNKIKILSNDNKKKPMEVVKEDASLAKKYGTMQHLQYVGMDKKKEGMKQLANQLLKQRGKVTHETHLEALGNEAVIAGTVVNIQAGMTKMEGLYDVITDQHTFENGLHNMSLTIREHASEK